MKNPGINIFIYLEYRKYLEEFYHLAKKLDSKFSFRVFSDAAGVKAPNFLQLLIQGKRNLKESTIPQVANALGLSPEETAYFRLLVQFDQEKVTEKKSQLFQELARKRKSYQIDTLTENQFEHYNKWYNKAIRELLGFYEFYPDEKYAFRNLASMVSPPIKESEARNAVKLMLNLGLLKKKGKQIVQTQRFVTTGDEVNSLFVRKFHETMIELARGSTDRNPQENRDISSLTVTVSDSGFANLKKEIQLFRKRLLEVVKADSDPENVYQVNFQLFPLTNVKKMKKVMNGNGQCACHSRE
jgi:uncharacterized protein (TIGR02147 family)